MRLTVLLLCVGLLAAPAVSATFLKIAGIEGESTDSGHKGEIEVVSFRITGNGLTFTKKIDSTSPSLFLRTAEGRHISDAVLTDGVNGKTYTFQDLVSTGFSQRIGSVTVEEVAWTFKSIKIVSPTTDSSKDSPPIAARAGGSTSPKPSGTTGQSLTILMKAEPIPESSTAMRSLEWAVRNSGGSKAQVQPFEVRKALDAGSDRLMQYSTTGQQISEVRLTLQRQGRDFVTYTLSDARVSDYSRTGSGETFKLRFAKIEVEFKASTAGGTKAAAPRAGWDINANKKV
jgi:type VI protein secretion system component Hcp